MLILIGITLAVGAFAATVIASASASRRSGLGDLGSVSTQWLSEHREYQDGSRTR